MFSHVTEKFSIYFGGAQDVIYPQEYLTIPADLFFAKTPAIQSLFAVLGLRHLFFAKQVHGVAGIQVTQDVLNHIPAFTRQADFIHTSKSQIGLGIMTADCLPVVIYDPLQKVIVAIHAGWRGAVAGVVMEALKAIQQAYGTNVRDIQIFFGPSAQVCCYQVGMEFISLLAQIPNTQDVLIPHENKLFFDVPRLIRNQLCTSGVLVEQIFEEYNVCTICDTRFFSHRRDGGLGGRQMTVVALR